MSKLLFSFLLVSISFFAFSQDHSYEGIKSKGTIPEDFTKFTLDKIKEAQEQALYATKSNRKARSEFYEISNFGVDQLLQSGRVCFNDTISNYVNQVFEEIRFANKSIPLGIRIYTVKSPVVNAFTTDQGIIFINTGLIAQLENEAQLAFILCHEIVHYMENHVMEGFIASSEISKSKNDYKRTSNIDKELATTRYSRKLETEADKKGLKMFLKTTYDPFAIDGVFDVLLYSYLPFDELPFDSSILEIGNYQIPDGYFLTEFKDIHVDENEDDSRHTHPNIGTRRRMANKLVNEAKVSGSKFLVSEKDFYAVRAAARYEVLRLQMINTQYSEALYSAFILQKEYPNNPLPKIAIGEILYGTALFSNTRDKRTVVGYYKKQQGYIQSTFYLLNKLQPESITLLALRYNLYLHQLYPENNGIENRITSLCKDLDYHHGVSFDDLVFSIPVKEEEIVSQSTDLIETPKTKSKYDRINARKKKKEKVSKTQWAKEIFYQSGDEDEIEEYFEKGKKLSEIKKYQLAKTDDPDLNSEARQQKAKYEKLKRNKGRALGIEKVVLVDPYYNIYNYTKEEVHQQVKSEKEEIQAMDNLEKIAQKTHLNLNILTPYKFAGSDISKYNDFSLLNEWVNERYSFGNRSNYTSSTEEIQDLVDRYGTKYFAWTGIVNTTLPRESKLLVALYSIYSIVGIPLGIYYATTKEKHTKIYFALFNIETGQLVMYENRDVSMSDSDGLLNSQYYDIFNQIRN